MIWVPVFRSIFPHKDSLPRIFPRTAKEVSVITSAYYVFQEAGVFIKASAQWVPPLSSALSEVIGFDASGQPRYVSSSSRFIALFGFILIFWLYAGVGLTIMAAGRKTPSDLHQTEKFMFSGWPCLRLTSPIRSARRLWASARGGPPTLRLIRPRPRSHKPTSYQM